MRILHLSDTHGFHRQINIPAGIDLVAFTGDESNHINPAINFNEFLDFMEWFRDLPVMHKLFIPGNHSTYIYRHESEAGEILEKNGIRLLNRKLINVAGINFYGEATVPIYGDWAYMANRNKMSKYWEHIPEETNVLLTHTPPKGILDTTENRSHELEMAGCSALRKKVEKLPALQAHLFGHIHDYKQIINTGTRQIGTVTFSNAAAVKDNEFQKGIHHHGNIIEIP